ncbi:MAG: hypothetical protein J6X66_14995 [Lachnospiraceae bacterium]|nr:hypothetical protein [Lachnospiraceae bacterium]
MKYTYKVITDKNEYVKWGPDAKICNIYDSHTGGTGEKDILTFGQLKRLFGAPAFITENMENQYQYYILAIDENGKTYHLSAYSGPSGPSIGGNVTDMKLIEAAKVLAGYIRDADTEDYDYSGYYMDANLKINCGIKDGKVYCTTKKLSFFESILVHIFKGI